MKRILQFFGVNIGAKIFNPEIDVPIKTTSAINLYDICRRYGEKVLVPEERNINHPEFVDFLKHSARPTMGISAGCLQIFRKPIIDIFEVLVNYHDGIIPRFRGLAATRWSCYLDEELTGYAFHHICETIDDGNILVQSAIPADGSAAFYDLEYKKTIHAVGQMERVIDMMVSRAPGKKGDGLPSYFSQRDFDNVTTLDSPSGLTFSEISKRLRVFGPLAVNIGGRYYPVTKFKRLEGKKHCPEGCFMTADKILLKPVRYMYLPHFFYKGCRFLKVS